MKRDTISRGVKSSRTYEMLEAIVREKVQEFVHDILEEEVSDFFGRRKSERMRSVDGVLGYRNGYGKPRQLSLQGGTVTVRRPRVRGPEERFESKILPLFKRRTEKVGELLLELYLHGLAKGDFELALRGLLGEGAPLSAGSIQRLKGKGGVSGVEGAGSVGVGGGLSMGRWSLCEGWIGKRQGGPADRDRSIEQWEKGVAGV